MLPVSGRGAVRRDRAEFGASAKDLAQRRVLQVGQACAALPGQEQVPQPADPGLGLELLDDRRRRPALGVCGELVGEHRLRGVHALVHELPESRQQVGCRPVECEIHT